MLRFRNILSMFALAVLCVVPAQVLATVTVGGTCGPLGAALTSYAVIGDAKLEVGSSAVTVNGNTPPCSGTCAADAIAPNGAISSISVTMPPLSPATFPATGSGSTSAATIGAGSYGTINANTNPTVFTGGTYYINTLNIGSGVTAQLAPGDYFIENLNFQNSANIAISPSGVVRLYIKFQFKGGAGNNYNLGGSVTDLQVFLYGGAEVDFGSNANFTGLIYSPSSSSTVELGNSSVFQGAVLTAGKVEIKSNTSITYTSAMQTAFSTISTCTRSTTVMPGRFNAYETSTPAGAISGVIKTRIAEQSFNLDLIAINTAGTAIESAFTGDVKVELLDASINTGALDANGCRSSWTTIQTLGTNPSFVAGDNGRKTVSFQEANAWKNVRVRITYPASGAPSAVGCSSDNFAIRPMQFSGVAVTDQNWTTAGTARSLSNASASGGAVHKAGQPLSLSAQAVGALGNVTTNYADMPAATPVACLLPTGCSNGNLGTFAVGGSAVAGVLASNNASYSEVGSFTIQLVDANFAAVDLADGSTAAERTISSAVVNVGRFVPDHFDLAASGTPQYKTFNDATCASRSFTYIGQPFGYVTAPQASVVARNAAGVTTVNYANDLWKLSAAGVTQTYTSVPATPALTATLGAPSVTSNNDGTGFVTANSSDTLSYARVGAAPFTAPFNANIALTMSVQDNAENVAGQGIITTTIPATFNGGGAGIAFDAGNAFRYGRLRLSNAHGSERLALNVPVRAEYFNGTLFVANAADSCTKFTLASDLALGNYQRNLAPGETTPGPASLALSGGAAAISLSAPGVGNSGSVDLTLSVPTWLQFNWTGAAGNPKGRATFGVYTNANEFIYLRESY